MRKSTKITVYLIHFDPPFAGRTHYIGATRRHPITRFLEHLKGRGAQTTKYAVRNGHKLILTCVWEDASWAFEKKLKTYKLRFERRHNCWKCRPDLNPEISKANS